MHSYRNKRKKVFGSFIRNETLFSLLDLNFKSGQFKLIMIFHRRLLFLNIFIVMDEIWTFFNVQ